MHWLFIVAAILMFICAGEMLSSVWSAGVNYRTTGWPSLRRSVLLGVVGMATLVMIGFLNIWVATWAAEASDWVFLYLVPVVFAVATHDEFFQTYKESQDFYIPRQSMVIITAHNNSRISSQN